MNSRTYEVGRSTITLLGDITASKAEALVSSDDYLLLMGGARILLRGLAKKEHRKADYRSDDQGNSGQKRRSVQGAAGQRLGHRGGQLWNECRPQQDT
jgi:hypothetical protein